MEAYTDVKILFLIRYIRNRRKCQYTKYIIKRKPKVFFGIAGLLSAFVSPIENQAFAAMRSGLLNRLPRGFDWTDFEYLKTFSKPIFSLSSK